MNYLIQQDQTTTTAIPWQHEFSMPSQRMALDYATRVAKLEKQDILLFVAATNVDTADWDYIATIKVKIEVVATVDRSRG